MNSEISGDLEKRIFDIGISLLEDAKKKKRFSIYDKIFSVCMENQKIKTQLLHFIDVLPSLKKREDFAGHMREYSTTEMDFGLNLRINLMSATSIISVPLLNIFFQRMANNFIVGEKHSDILASLEKQIRYGMEFTIDRLGEKTTSEIDADRYENDYFNLLNILEKKFGTNAKDKTGKPRINISLKTSSLYSRFDPINQLETKMQVKKRLRNILERAKDIGAFVNIDTEHNQTKKLSSEIFKELLLEDEFKNFYDVGIVVQAYLRDSEEILMDFICWSRRNEHPITTRLVKGAYWDHEVMLAQRNGWDIPVYTSKIETDSNYEKLTKIILENNNQIGAAIASHNIRSISNSLAIKERLNINDRNFEVQMLYGMGQEIKESLISKKVPIRVYVPYGNLISGMGYFVRRLLENSSNESFLRTLDSNINARILLKKPNER